MTEIYEKVDEVQRTLAVIKLDIKYIKKNLDDTISKQNTLCTEQSPCHTLEKLNNHLDIQKDFKADFKFYATLILGNGVLFTVLIALGKFIKII